MLTRAGCIHEAALLALSLGPDPPPAGFRNPFAKQIGGDPDAVVSRDIAGRVDSAQMNKAGEGRALHSDKRARLLVLRLV